MWKSLFDTRPKRRRVDLYDFDEEYRRLASLLTEPLVVVKGLRRTGKTSLILTTLEEEGAYYVVFDVREGFTSRRDLYRMISKGVGEFMRRLSARRVLLDVLIGLLKSVRGVSVEGISVSISWGRDRPLLTELLSKLDHFALRAGLRVVVVFDEVQRLRGVLKSEVAAAIAYAYDYAENLTFILSGSEMGLLYDFLGDPNSPLYGRAYIPISTRKLSRLESRDFLIKGFEEVGAEVPEHEVEEAIDSLDGIIGWLTYYGYSRWRGGKSLKEIREEAVALALSELRNMLKYRVSRRYPTILKALAEGVRRWSELKEYVERVEGKVVSDRVLHDVLKQLKRHSVINDELEFTDPILREAAKRL